MLKKSDIIVYIPVYQDQSALSRNLDYLEKLGLKALVVDSRFTDFPQIDGSDYSTDGTKEMVESRGHRFFQFESCREQDKLNEAMGYASFLCHKVFMYIGADAYLDGDIDEFMINLQRQYEKYVIDPTILLIEAVELQPNAKWNNTGTRQPRILLNYNNMESRHLHWVMYKKGAKDDDPLTANTEIINGLKIYHDNTVRTKERDDLMTKYQNKNVPRERKEYLHKVAKRAYKSVRLLIWIEDIAGSYTKARAAFAMDSFSHLIFVKKGYTITSDMVKQFHDTIKETNNVMSNIQVFSAVWNAADGRITLDPKEQYTSKLPTDAIKGVYSKKGFVPTSKYIPVPWTAGPIICMDYQVVRLIENMGDDLDFMTFCNQLGFTVHGLSEIRV